MQFLIKTKDSETCFREYDDDDPNPTKFLHRKSNTVKTFKRLSNKYPSSLYPVSENIKSVDVMNIYNYKNDKKNNRKMKFQMR